MASSAERSSSQQCIHSSINTRSTRHAATVGYSQPTLPELIAASTRSGILKETPISSQTSSGPFPAPLVLPGDDLALYPNAYRQSLRSWVHYKWRNEITPDRRTIYLSAPPAIHKSAAFVKEWTKPQVSGAKIAQPKTSQVIKYLEAFYFGLPVRELPKSILQFTADVDDLENVPGAGADPAANNNVHIIGLDTKSDVGCKGIRTRATPEGSFSHQMNLSDILDAGMRTIPDDAYALVIQVEHDLYEDEDDEFVCGRAYGGSRIAVVSTARYHPALDNAQDIERGHAWPASHCQAYLDACLDAEQPKQRKKAKRPRRGEKEAEGIESSCSNAMQEAISAHNALPSLEGSVPTKYLSGLWLGRVCRTVSHELGHCFGMEHCSYYACSMQGSASIIEDARQPPYMCPIELAKILYATGANLIERYKAIASFCDAHEDVHLFAAYGAWVRARIEEIETEVVS